MSKLLIVEDSSFQRSFIGAIALELGFEVYSASDGREGLAAALEHEPDCIITDILMPKMDGLDMIDAMKKNGQSTPFIVVSADIQKTTQARAKELGAASFLSKPVNKTAVVEALAAVFDD